MINVDDRYLLKQAGFTERQINTHMRKFYNLFRVAPMPQMKKEWIGLTDGEINQVLSECHAGKVYPQDMYLFATARQKTECRAIEAKLKEKNC